MVRHIVSLILILVSFPLWTKSQSVTFIVKKSSFSSDKYDEYCPVYYNNGIVFCSNRNHNIFFDYSTSQNKGLFKINYIDTTGKVTWQKAELFSKNLTTRYNDGPVSFNKHRDTIYYSRNQKVEGKIRENSSPRNTLGVFMAILENKKWTKIKELRFNNEYYNITTPCISPDGKKLFFASDKSGGFGGSDIYYCQWKNDYWDNPVNLGPVINTKGNESYPFLNADGELFFSSDGYPGLGGKDIFYSKHSGSDWRVPVRLDYPINTKFDDFGIITDSLIKSGYFSSNRDKSIDIFQFKTDAPPIFYADIQRENQYCLRFVDTGAIDVDSLKLKYEWYFGDKQKASGADVSHCFLGPGRYDIQLNLLDRTTKNLFFSKLSYTLILKEIEQPYINSPDITVSGNLIEFDGLKSHLPGFTILTYSWDFGDGTQLQGDKVQHSFFEKGDYNVTLSLTLQSDSSGKKVREGISKKIKVVSDNQEKDLYLAEISSLKSVIPDVRKYENASIETIYSAEDEIKKNGIFGVELLSSKTKISISSYYFRNVPKNYTIKEIFNPTDTSYSYVSDRQTGLMDVYQGYRDMIAAGYKNAVIKIFEIRDPAEQELFTLLNRFGSLADLYFDNNDRLTPNAYLLLDQIVKLMNKYPIVKLELAVYSDISDFPDNSLKRAQYMINYLVNRGISIRRLSQRSYGSSRPVTESRTEKDKRQNRRISIRILDV